MNLSAVFALLLVNAIASAQGFYQNTDVFELSPDSFDEVVLSTNYTSVVEFYAPWCGHCNNFKGAFKKAGKLLKDIVNVAAVNCDLEINKPLCAKYKIEGFPTIKVFRPPKYSDKNPPKSKKALMKEFVDENYNGERTASGLVGFSQTRIKSYVRRIFGVDVLQKLLNKSSKIKMILLSDSKNKPSVFLKSLAIDYLGVAEFGYFDVKSSFPEEKIMELTGLDNQAMTKPMFLVYDGNNPTNEPKIITGKMTKQSIAEFLLENYGVKPMEGPGSEKHKTLNLLKKGKTLKQIQKKGKNNRKKSVKKSARDEL